MTTPLRPDMNSNAVTPLTKTPISPRTMMVRALTGSGAARLRIVSQPTAPTVIRRKIALKSATTIDELWKPCSAQSGVA